MPIERFDFDKLAEEMLVLTFDFSNGLVGNEVLVGVPTVLVSVARGKDAAPSSLLNGIGQLDATAKQLLLPVMGGNRGAEYLIRVVMTTSNDLKTLALEAILPVV